MRTSNLLTAGLALAGAALTVWAVLDCVRYSHFLLSILWK